MKGNFNNNQDENAFEKQLEEIEEYQRHVNDHGYWLGGKMSLLQRNLSNKPSYIIPFGIVMLIFGIGTFIHEIGNKKGIFQIAAFSSLWIAFIMIFSLITIRGIKIFIRERRDKR